MFAYDLRLALQSLKRHPGLSALMVLAIALGIAVCTMTFTVYHAMATNPIAWKSDQLYAVTLDTWDPTEPYNEKEPELPPTLVTYRDATALQAAGITERDIYVTNAVKHFKWEPRGKRRIHKRPNASEISACRSADS